MYPNAPGNMTVGGKPTMIAGFMSPTFDFLRGGRGALSRAEDVSRYAKQLAEIERLENDPAIKRFDLAGDMSQIAHQLGGTLSQARAEISRAITSATSGYPVRENLEAPARVLVPLETPMRNRIPRVAGSGTSTSWKQIVSLGGGYGFQTVVTAGGAANATQPVTSTAGMRPGDILWFGIGVPAARTVSSVPSATSVILTATITTTGGETVTNTSLPVGAGANALSQGRAFFTESGAPADHTPAWATRNELYKLLGAMSSITQFAISAGMSYENQWVALQRALLQVTMLNEENCIINSSSTQTTPPFGDGTNALGFDGLRASITTVKGTPAVQVQTGVGALTLSHCDRQITNLWEQGGTGLWMLMGGNEMLSLTHLAEAAGSIIRVQATTDGRAVLGLKVKSYVHSISGAEVEIIPSRFMASGASGSSAANGEIIFGSSYLPDGSPALDMSVLPQFPLPMLNIEGGDNIQGYAVQQVSPDAATPQVYPSLVSVYETLRVISAAHFARSSGLSPV